jgi:hypothetical protein
MARVTPSIEKINDAAKYEFFGGHDASGSPIWTRDFSRIKPLVDWNNNGGCVTMTYDAPLKKYLLVITDGGNTISRFNTYILESDHITGPWKLVVYMRHFGEGTSSTSPRSSSARMAVPHGCATPRTSPTAICTRIIAMTRPEADTE